MLTLNINYSQNNSVKLNRQIDSLRFAFKNAGHDTIKINILFCWGKIMSPDQADSALRLYLKAISLAEKNASSLPVTDKIKTVYLQKTAKALQNIALIYKNQNKPDTAVAYYFRSTKKYLEANDKFGEAWNYFQIGNTLQQLNNPKKALEYFKLSLKIREEIKDKTGIGKTLYNIALIYDSQGQIKEAIDCYQKSLKIFEEINYINGIAAALNNIANIYKDQGETNEALEYYKKILKMEGDDNFAAAAAFINIGIIYYEQFNNQEALKYFERGLRMQESLQNFDGIASALHNIGMVQRSLGNLQEAIVFYQRALKMYKDQNDKQGVALTLENIGIVYQMQGNIKKATEYGEKSLTLANELGYPEKIRDAAKFLAEIYKNEKAPVRALEMYELYILMRDSINNKETRTSSIKSKLKYDFEKKEAEKAVLVAEEKKVAHALLKQEKIKSYALFGGLALTGLFGAFMVNRFRIINKQKKIIEEQKALVDLKQREVMDSIRYAKRIQQSLLPSEKYLHRVLEKTNKNG